MSNPEKEYEERLRKRLPVLKKYIEEGKVKLNSLETIKSLEKIKYGLDGEIDLSTVDGSVRSLALAIEHFHEREELKKVLELNEVQNRYFEIIYSNFEPFHKAMIDSKSNPHTMAHYFAYESKNYNELADVTLDFFDMIKDFWKAHYEFVEVHIEDMFESTKAVFGGDLFPSYTQNIASKAGIYIDTIILPCPFVRSAKLFESAPEKDKVYFLLKHALNILNYKELALAETNNPIIVILPDREMLFDEFYNRISKLSLNDGLLHASKIFGRDFKDQKELFEFAIKLDTIEKTLENIPNPERVLINIKDKKNLKDQLNTYIKDPKMINMIGTDCPGIVVADMGFGRMGTINELLFRSSRLGGTPLIDAPTSWEYFKWKLEYDTERSFKVYKPELHIVKGLNHLSNTKHKWIGKIPPLALIEIRKSGAIDEIRQILNKDINELVSASPDDFKSTSHKVFNNLNNAFIKHERSIQELSKKKWKFAGQNISSWLVVGGIEITAACIGTPLYGASSVIINQLTEAPKIKDFPEKFNEFKEYSNKQEELKKSPIGMIFKYKSD